VGRLQTGTLSLPKHPIAYLSLGILVSTLVSSIFSTNQRLSLLGVGLEQDTFISLLILVFLMFLLANYFRSRRLVFSYYLATMVAGLMVILVQVLVILGVFWPSYFTGGASNLIGKWNSLAIYLGFITLLATLLLENLYFTNKKYLKIILWAVFGLGVLSLVFINFNISWYLVGTLSLIYLFEKKVTWRQWSRLATGLVVLSLVFVIFGRSGSFLNQKISNLNSRAGVSNLEVRPSWTGTWTIVRQALVEKGEKRPAIVSTLVGVGPNQFAYEWAKYKPLGVNETMFWNVDFNAGVGLLPSMMVGTGLLGMAFWILFLGALIIFGLRTWRQTLPDEAGRPLVLISLLAMFYFWAAAIFYVTDLTTFSLAFIFTGVWLGLSTGLGALPEEKITFRSGISRLIFSLIIALLLLAALGSFYYGGRHYRSLFLFRQGVYELNRGGSLEDSQNLIVKAIGLSEQDLYYRSLIDLSLTRMNQLVNTPNLPQEQILGAFSQALLVATTSANRAIYLDRGNYLNYAYSGKLYEALVPLQVRGAYDWALASYREAARVSPKNPSVYTDMARLEIINGNRAGAENYIKRALEHKPNFSTAYTLRAQISADKNDIAGAITNLKQAAAFDPQNSDILFQLGSLQYKNADYAGSAATLEQAVALYPSYSNARYFLGLSYSRLGEAAKAIKQFEEIKALNPDNAEVKTILENLQAGRPAVTPPAPVPATKTVKADTKKK
jgi:tetratricopeptide (TPR) repeat protein